MKPLIRAEAKLRPYRHSAGVSKGESKFCKQTSKKSATSWITNFASSFVDRLMLSALPFFLLLGHGGGGGPMGASRCWDASAAVRCFTLRSAGHRAAPFSFTNSELRSEVPSSRAQWDVDEGRWVPKEMVSGRGPAVAQHIAWRHDIGGATPLTCPGSRPAARSSRKACAAANCAGRPDRSGASTQESRAGPAVSQSGRRVPGGSAPPLGWGSCCTYGGLMLQTSRSCSREDYREFIWVSKSATDRRYTR